MEALRRNGLDEYFVSPMINWTAKSENIKALVNVLNIGMDTLVFVDDSFFELNEVRMNCPGIRVCDAKDIEQYVTTDIFDVPVTEDSKRRRISYQENSKRKMAEMEFSDDATNFLRSCNMVVHVNKPIEQEFARCYELVQRTNQLNLSAERLTLDQITEMVNSSDYDCYRIKVKDNFGDYGLVGFAIFDVTDKKNVILRHFVFSCRAARKKIEPSFFEYIIKKYHEQGYKRLILLCKITEKNRLMRQVLEDSNMFVRTEESDEGYKLVHEMTEKMVPLNLMTISMD